MNALVEMETVLNLQDCLTEKQLTALRGMVEFYRDFNEELYDYPAEETLFTESQRELFQIFDVFRIDR
tara:strand:- start:216 stop:419 length:204 start_codon:yes stop_codon:yes gene_type:complete